MPDFMLVDQSMRYTPFGALTARTMRDIETLSESFNVLGVLRGQIRQIYFPGNNRVMAQFSVQDSFAFVPGVPVCKRANVQDSCPKRFSISGKIWWKRGPNKLNLHSLLQVAAAVISEVNI